MSSNSKTYYLKKKDIDKKLRFFEFWLICLKIMVLKANIGFGLLTKYPRIRPDQKTYFLRNEDIDKKS